MKQTTAIIAAAGQGERLSRASGNTPKQFIELSGMPVFIWSLTTFLQHAKIQEVVLVVPEQWLDKARTLVLQYLPQYIDQVRIIAGGKSRQESVYLALEELSAGGSTPVYVLIHDAARPFVTDECIDQVIATIEKGFACTLGIPLSDSIKKIEDMTIVEHLDRNSMVLVQTPQGSEFHLMLDAHRCARSKKHVTTDDAALVQAYGAKTKIVPGSSFNLKITEANDMLIAQAFVDTHGWRPGKVSKPEMTSVPI